MADRMTTGTTGFDPDDAASGPEPASLALGQFGDVGLGYDCTAFTLAAVGDEQNG